ncbi:hypothetical protein QQ045_031611 [Rhodiola kirilowii]
MSYSESEYFKQTMRPKGPSKPMDPHIPRMPQLHDFQFFNTWRISDLYEKEVKHLMRFQSWSRRDFNAFIRACEKYGRKDLKSIASEIEGKTEEEVERYAKVFNERYKELNVLDSPRGCGGGSARS